MWSNFQLTLRVSSHDSEVQYATLSTSSGVLAGFQKFQKDNVLQPTQSDRQIELAGTGNLPAVSTCRSVQRIVVKDRRTIESVRPDSFCMMEVGGK